MKRTLILLAAALAFASCTNDNDCTCPKETYKLVTCDNEDNLVQLDGAWLTNSNLDHNNWQVLQNIGFEVNNPYFTVQTTNGQKILDASLFNFNYPYTLTRINDYKVVFYCTQMAAYLNDTDLFFVNLKLTPNAN